MTDETKIAAWKEEIRNLQDAYSLAMDHGDYHYFDEIFLEDIQADYGVAGTGNGLASLKQICTEALTPLDSVQHMNGNHWVRFGDDFLSARGGCYFRVHMTRNEAVGGAHFEMGGKYTDELVLIDTGWRIAKRRIDLIWSSGNPEVRYPTVT